MLFALEFLNKVISELLLSRVVGANLTF